MAGDGTYFTEKSGMEAPARWSHDPEVIKEREQIDYSKRVSYEDAKKGTGHRRPRVYADGVYDMFHFGHARLFMQMKNAFPGAYVIAGVVTDEDTHRFKGKTVMTLEERAESARHCRYIDEIVLGAPWACSFEFMSEMKIDFVAHDGIPYCIGSATDLYQPFREANCFLETKRTETISTTEMIERIVTDYDTYVKRNEKQNVIKGPQLGFWSREEIMDQQRRDGQSTSTSEKKDAAS